MRHPWWSTLRTFAGISAVTLLLAVVAYGLFLYVRSADFYDYAKCGTRGWINSPHELDAELGFRAAPGKTGEEFYAVGPNIVSRISRDGFRIPVGAPDTVPTQRPLVLSLGCSFAFGSSTLAEENYAYLFAAGLHGTALNAGVSSYGLSHMLLRARKLIPRYKPDIVIFQYAPWLVDRSFGYAPTYFAKLPGPYFYRAADGGLRLHGPFYLSQTFDVKLDAYRDCHKSLWDRLRFFATVAAPLLVTQDARELATRYGMLRGTIPVPVRDRMAVLQAASTEIERLCRENGASLFVLALDNPDTLDDAAVRREKDWLAAHFKERFVDTRPVLAAYAGAHHQTPRLLFTLMREGKQMDGHPNALAHRLYAEALARAYAAQATPQPAQ